MITFIIHIKMVKAIQTLSYSIRWSVTKEEEIRVSDDIRVQNDPTRPSCFKQMRIASRSVQCDLRVSRKPRFKQAQREARVQKHPTRSPCFKDKTRVASSFFQHQSISLLLQSFQQYTSKSNHQLYWFNSTPINKSELR